MRFDKEVFFQTVIPGEYDAATGDYYDGSVSEIKRYACVTCTEIKTLNLIYGHIKQGTFTVRLQRPYKEPFDRMRIDSKLYNVDYESPLRNKTVFVVSEVQ